MSGKDGHFLVQPAPRDRDARGGGPGQGGTHAGHYFEIQSRGGQCFRFLRTATEDKRIAPFQTHNRMPGLCFLDEQAVDVPLGHGVVAGFFSGVNQLRFGRCETKQLGVGKIVINDDTGPLQCFAPAQGEHSGITGTGTNEKTFSFIHPHKRAATVRPNSSAWSGAPMLRAIFGEAPGRSNRTASR